MELLVIFGLSGFFVKWFLSFGVPYLWREQTFGHLPIMTAANSQDSKGGLLVTTLTTDNPAGTSVSNRSFF